MNELRNKFQSMVEERCIASHKEAWELLELPKNRDEIVDILLSLANSEYHDAIGHIQGYYENGSGLLRECAKRVLQELNNNNNI